MSDCTEFSAKVSPGAITEPVQSTDPIKLAELEGTDAVCLAAAQAEHAPGTDLFSPAVASSANKISVATPAPIQPVTAAPTTAAVNEFSESKAAQQQEEKPWYSKMYQQVTEYVGQKIERGKQLVSEIANSELVASAVNALSEITKPIRNAISWLYERSCDCYQAAANWASPYWNSFTTAVSDAFSAAKTAVTNYFSPKKLEAPPTEKKEWQRGADEIYCSTQTGYSSDIVSLILRLEISEVLLKAAVTEAEQRKKEEAIRQLAAALIEAEEKERKKEEAAYGSEQAREGEETLHELQYLAAMFGELDLLPEVQAALQEMGGEFQKEQLVLYLAERIRHALAERDARQAA
jgi:hypothetical protein